MVPKKAYAVFVVLSFAAQAHAQAEAGLIGEIDRRATCSGTIVCRDGLRLGMVLPEEFRAIGSEVGLEPEVHEVDGSSVFAIWGTTQRMSGKPHLMLRSRQRLMPQCPLNLKKLF